LENWLPPSNRLLPRKKIIFCDGAMDHGGTSANRNKYSRSGTMDLLKQFEDREKFCKKTPIYIISPIFVHLYRTENAKDDISSKNYFKSLKKSAEVLS
jgi:hypothetical protein